MLKIMRSHKFFSVFVLGFITIVITIAFVFWGIGPQLNPNVVVAMVGDEKITIAEYQESYYYAYQKARELAENTEDMKEFDLKNEVIFGLINRKVLKIAAVNAGLTVTEKELRDEIFDEPAFQKDGVFNKRVYEKRLRLIRKVPQGYERDLRGDLLLNKMRRMIGETAELSARQKETINSIKSDNIQLSEIFLSASREMAIQAYIEGLKRQIKITVNKEIIS